MVDRPLEPQEGEGEGRGNKTATNHTESFSQPEFSVDLQSSVSSPSSTAPLSVSEEKCGLVDDNTRKRDVDTTVGLDVCTDTMPRKKVQARRRSAEMVGDTSRPVSEEEDLKRKYYDVLYEVWKCKVLRSVFPKEVPCVTSHRSG